MPKYKLGDKVTIKDEKWFKSHKTDTFRGYIIIDSMLKYCNQTYTIIGNPFNGYHLDTNENNSLVWTDEMIMLLKEKRKEKLENLKDVSNL